ncbi:hypothetical protein GX50_05185, partial [[Emmonsia] crescens]
MVQLSETSTQSEDIKASSEAAPINSALREAKLNNTSSGSPRPNCSCIAAKTALLKSDVMIRRLVQFTSTAYGQERLLAMIQYNSQILHYLLHSPPLRSISARLHSILIPSATASAAGVSKSSQSPTPKAIPALLALSSLMSETRTTLRLFGLLSLWSWGSATLKAPPADPILRTIAYTQVTINILYQILENVAHLASKGVLERRLVERWGSVGKWYVWSTRAWLGHVLLEFARVWREYVISRERRGWGGKVEGGEGEGEGEGDEEDAARRAEVREWKKSL